jgi:hypothetical protein
VTVAAVNGIGNFSTAATPPSGQYYTGGFAGAVSGTTYFIATSGGASGTTASYSTNLTTWASGTLPAGGEWGQGAYGVISGTPYFVIPNNQYSTSYKYITYSTNATTWTLTSISYYGYATMIYGTVSGTPYFITPGGNAGTSTGLYSTNGTSWSTFSMPSSVSWWGAAAGTIGSSTYFVTAAFSSSSAAYSTNATTWTATSMPASEYWMSIAYGNPSTPIFVAITGNTSTVAAYSTSGTSWTSMTLPSAAQSPNVAYGGGFFTYVGPSGIVYSSNGTTWTNGPTIPIPPTSGGSVPIALFTGSISSTNYLVLQPYSAAGVNYAAVGPILPVSFGIYEGPATTY